MDGIDFYITDAFGEGLYDSCKDVKFGTMNTRAIEFIGAGAQNFRGTLCKEVVPKSVGLCVHLCVRVHVRACVFITDVLKLNVIK